jgi:hypothetical protein
VNFTRRRTIPLFLIAICICLVACRGSEPKKSRIAPAAVHQIAREFADAARKAAPSGTVIRIKQADASAASSSPDRIEVTLFDNGDVSARKKETAQVFVSLGAVAQRHSLQTAERRDQAD